MSTITRPAATVQEMPTFSASSAMALMADETDSLLGRIAALNKGE